MTTYTDVRWNFDCSTWGRFHACAAWIPDSYATQPTCWCLPYREVYSTRDTHHWPQKEYAHKNFWHTMPISESPKRKPWEEANHTPGDHLRRYRRQWFRTESPRLPDEHAAAASLSASWACSRRGSKSETSRCGKHPFLSITSQNYFKNINFTDFFLAYTYIPVTSFQCLAGRWAALLTDILCKMLM